MPLSKEMLDFLVENKMRNDRPWYNERKPLFAELVLAPLQELVLSLTPVMRDIDGMIECAPKVDKTLSRVYRDTRFTHDKSLFRDVMWIVFQKNKHAHPGEWPGYWFEIGPTGMGWGCGHYQASTDYMRHLRQMVLADDPAFQKARKMVEKQEAFVVEGERYKRSKHPDQPEALRFWLDRKGVGLSKNSRDFSMAFSDELAQMLSADFQRIAPMYHFLCKVEESRQRE